MTMAGIASRSQLRMSLLRFVLVCVPLALLLGTVARQLAGPGPAGPLADAARLLVHGILGLVLALLLHARGARGRGLAAALAILVLFLHLAWPVALAASRDTGLAVMAAAGLATILLALLAWRIRRLATLLLLAALAWLGWTALDLREVEPQPPAADIVL